MRQSHYAAVADDGGKISGEHETQLIEGAEFDLFASSPDELVRKIKYLVIEIHYHYDQGTAKVKILTERLKALGFVDITIEETHRTNFLA